MWSVPLTGWINSPDMRRALHFRKRWLAPVTPMVFCLLACPSFCRAESLGEPSPDMTAALLQMIWSLLLVIALILALYALFRKKFSVTANQQGKAIRIVEMRPLGGKKSLCLVEVDRKRLLLGIAENTISVLADVTADKTFAATLEHCQQQKEQPEQPLQQMTE